MLIPKKYVLEATTLTREGVVAALAASGYGNSDGIRGVEFLGMNDSANFVYKITYPDEDNPGSEASGNIYIQFKPHHAGRAGEYVLLGEY